MKENKRGWFRTLYIIRLNQVWPEMNRCWPLPAEEGILLFLAAQGVLISPVAKTVISVWLITKIGESWFVITAITLLNI